MTSKRNERGSAALEAVIAIPAFLLFVALVIAAGRIAMARQGVQAAAAEAARQASIARTAGEAVAKAQVGGQQTLADQGLQCVHVTVRPRHVRFRGARRDACLGQRHRDLSGRPVGGRDTGPARVADHRVDRPVALGHFQRKVRMTPHPHPVKRARLDQPVGRPGVVLHDPHRRNRCRLQRPGGRRTPRQGRRRPGRTCCRSGGPAGRVGPRWPGAARCRPGGGCRPAPTSRKPDCQAA